MCSFIEIHLKSESPHIREMGCFISFISINSECKLELKKIFDGNMDYNICPDSLSCCIQQKSIKNI